MNRLTLLALAALLPAVASAQAIRCKDPASGKILYTDQPCPGGELVVPPRSQADIAQDAANAAAARERERERERTERLREERALRQEQLRAQQASAPALPSESDACRAARAEASFRAASVTASAEEVHTARYNAALACGQPPPADIVVVPPPVPVYPVHPGYSGYPGYPGYPGYRPPHWQGPHRPPPPGGGFGMPVPQRPAPPDPRTEDVPVRVVPPSVQR